MKLPAIQAAKSASPLLKLGLVVLGGIVIYKFAGKAVDQIQNNQFNNDYSGDCRSGVDTSDTAAARVATSYYQAIHENDWWGVSEDEEAIIALGNQRVCFSNIAKKYRQKYNRDLLTDIAEGLSVSEMAEFNRNLSAAQG